MWHKVQESYKLKPKLEAHSDGNQACLNAVNAIRDAEGLKLEKFTAAANDRGKQSRTPSTPYEDALYNVTCAQIEDGSIDPKVEETYTLIYAVKEGQQPPTASEAVDIWKSGYEQLGPDTPPAFKAKGEHIRAAAAASEIYYDNTVAGFVSLMVDGTREIRCYNATGCKKAALICFLSKPTLVENTPPISEGTWKKILALDNEANGNGAGDTIKFTLRSEADNCLTEINEVRSQDSLGLSSFVAKAQTSTGAAPEDVAPTESVELAKAFTCDVIKAGNAPILFSNNKRSVMYYSGSSATCSNAITEWKKGYDKFKDLTIPPTYTSSEDIYKTGAATNFISLVSEGDETVVRCYTVEKCSEEGLLCVLEPAVFEDGTAPITEATWQKVTSTFSNGVSGTSVYGALLSSVLVAVGLFALNF
ncbi:SAG family member [Eimeria maxima]|uniref:SAG family member n=1 Tax=Eimeria maxima TaxID=5804 RepID=U6M4D3_EIMMA|nr:SAG family member [Eimeria maxima]CDJ57943.1 SAG family member [Eimeria maxima]